MDEHSRMNHFRGWGFPERSMNVNPILKPLAGSAVLGSSLTAAQPTATTILNGGFTERKTSLAEVHAATTSLSYSGHPWAVIPAGLSTSQASAEDLEITVKEINKVLGVPPEEEDRDDTDTKPAKKRKQRAPSKASNSNEGKVSKAKQAKRDSVCTRKKTNSVSNEKSEKMCRDIVINGETCDISSIAAPVCSCTGIPRQCYKWGVGGWQSSCCTTTMSVYPLPLNNTRPGARVAGRKMSIGAYRKVLEKVAAEGHDFSTAVDLKNYWAKHGTNKFVTIR